MSGAIVCAHSSACVVGLISDDRSWRPCSPMPVRPYTAEQQRAMADELESRPNHPLGPPMTELRDWRIAGRLLTLCWQEDAANAH